MAEWNTIPSFAAGQVVRANTFQLIHENLYTLKNPLHAAQSMPGPSLAEWTSTSVGFVDIDATYYRVSFESSGNDLLLTADLIDDHSSLSAIHYFDFAIDGIRIGNSLGLLGRSSNYGREVVNIHYIVENIAAGEHEIAVQFATTSGTNKVEKEACMKIQVWEF